LKVTNNRGLVCCVLLERSKNCFWPFYWPKGTVCQTIKMYHKIWVNCRSFQYTTLHYTTLIQKRGWNLLVIWDKIHSLHKQTLLKIAVFNHSNMCFKWN